MSTESSATPARRAAMIPPRRMEWPLMRLASTPMAFMASFTQSLTAWGRIGSIKPSLFLLPSRCLGNNEGQKRHLARGFAPGCAFSQRGTPSTSRCYSHVAGPHDRMLLIVIRSKFVQVALTAFLTFSGLAGLCGTSKSAIVSLAMRDTK